MLSNHLSPNLILSQLKKLRRNEDLRVAALQIKEQPLPEDRLDAVGLQEGNRCRQNNLKNRHLMLHLHE